MWSTTYLRRSFGWRGNCRGRIVASGNNARNTRESRDQSVPSWSPPVTSGYQSGQVRSRSGLQIRSRTVQSNRILEAGTLSSTVAVFSIILAATAKRM